MIARTLLLLAATPIFALPAEKGTQNPIAGLVEAFVPTGATESKPESAGQTFPAIAPIISSVASLFTPKGRRSAEETVAPVKPDAIVIPIPNEYQVYPAARYPVPPHHLNQHPHQQPYPQTYPYPHQQNYPNVQEPFLVVPLPHIQKVFPVDYVAPYPKQYTAPNFLFQIPKIYFGKYQEQAQGVQQNSQVQHIVGKSGEATAVEQAASQGKTGPTQATSQVPVAQDN